MTKTTKCIDSNTQVMVSASAGQDVQCGSCGRSVSTYVRHGDTNQIPMISLHAKS